MFRFATDISAAMAYVHSQGFLHRDLKPSNILVGIPARITLLTIQIFSLNENDEVTAKLCDFGAGRRAGIDMTQFIGTIPYVRH